MNSLSIFLSQPTSAIPHISIYPLCCLFPLLSSAAQAFENADVALLVGAKPRGPGMERGDLLKQNGAIFAGQGKAINQWASKNIKVVVVGNPVRSVDICVCE